MKLVSFTVEGQARVGVADEAAGTVRDVTAVVPSVRQAIEQWGTVVGQLVLPQTASGANVGQLDSASGPELALADLELTSPIPDPVRNIFCIGKNYRDHVAEFGRSGYDSPDKSEDLPDKPIVFSKVTTSVTGPYADVDPHHGVTSELDYEGELGVIIGKGGRGISAADAYEHVWGYTVIDDVTARDLQRDHKQWLLGKSLDTHCPMGPYAVSADEVVDVTALEVTTTVNGERRQHAPVKDLIFDIPELIATISAGITLLPGDVIATGTPAGVGIGFDPPKFLQSGDVVEVSITGLGSIRNRIA